MRWPQITLIIITTLGLGIDIAQHGNTRSESNFFITLLSTIILYFLLIVGGFFN